MLTGSMLSMLHYDPDTGEWKWVKCSAHNSDMNGKIAGYLDKDGYRTIRIGGTSYRAGRLAWLWMTGQWPDPEVDHIDRDPSNDKWDNLREATSSQNKYNRRPNGLRGVYRSGSKWWVMVGRQNYLGTFPTLEGAILARDAEAERLGGPFAILNAPMELA